MARGREFAEHPGSAAVLGVVDEVHAIELDDVRRAASIVTSGEMRARDALHLAVMHRHGMDQILTFDHGFDGIPGIRRVGEAS